MKISTTTSALIVVGTMLAIGIGCSQLPPSDKGDDYLNFPAQLSSTTPFDVDTALEHKLLREQKFDEAQRIFEVLSWQMFISLNWPVDDKGKPKPEITDEGGRIWEKWKESYEVFKEDGDKPHVWGAATDLPDELEAKVKSKKGNLELLFRTSKFSSFKDEKWNRQKGRKSFVQPDEVDQAFTSPIWDQSGNVIRYEIRLNRPTVDYIVENELYNFDGQIKFSSEKKTVSFPSGSVMKAGSVELKFAWKVIVPGKDVKERYFTKKVLVLDSNKKAQEVTVGLVGMHIGTKTVSSPQWIWATFEQVDNVETNTLEKVDGHYLRPSFNNPDCSTCPINVFPDGKHPVNQIQRVIPIPGATQELNKQVQTILKGKKSFWQYYQLIGTQWPTDPSSPPYPLNAAVYKLPDAVTNKSGGKPTPTFLTNMVMETYFQGATNTDSPSHYNQLIANEPARFQIEGVPTNDPANTGKLIFGTEGCVNCHSSASIAISFTVDSSGNKKPVFGAPRIGDFEWLLQRKAQFKTKKIPSKSTK
ncbi:MAG TPA: hypothetical protein VGC08_13420 [Pedobacter sp.]